MEKDDQDWARILAGQPTADARADTRREAESLRHAIVAARNAESSPELDVESGLQRLLFRLRQQPPASEAPRRRPWQAYAGMAMAASLALVVGLTMLRPDRETTREYPSEPVYRGAAPQVLTTDNPRQLKDAIARDLEAAGVQPAIIELGRVVTLEAEWPETPSKAALDL